MPYLWSGGLLAYIDRLEQCHFHNIETNTARSSLQPMQVSVSRAAQRTLLPRVNCIASRHQRIRCARFYFHKNEHLAVEYHEVYLVPPITRCPPVRRQNPVSDPFQVRPRQPLPSPTRFTRHPACLTQTGFPMPCPKPLQPCEHRRHETQKTPKNKKALSARGDFERALGNWMQGLDLNQGPSGYEPDELPDCSTLRIGRLARAQRLSTRFSHFFATSFHNRFTFTAQGPCRHRFGKNALALARTPLCFCRSLSVKTHT